MTNSKGWIKWNCLTSPTELLWYLNIFHYYTLYLTNHRIMFKLCNSIYDARNLIRISASPELLTVHFLKCSHSLHFILTFQGVNEASMRFLCAKSSRSFLPLHVSVRYGMVIWRGMQKLMANNRVTTPYPLSFIYQVKAWKAKRPGWQTNCQPFLLVFMKHKGRDRPYFSLSWREYKSRVSHTLTSDWI